MTGSDDDNRTKGEGRGRRRRGSRGGRNRNRSGRSASGEASGEHGDSADDGDGDGDGERNPELPDRAIEGRPKSKEAAERSLVRKPRIGDTKPAPEDGDDDSDAGDDDAGGGSGQSRSGGSSSSGGDGDGKRRRRRGGRGGRGGRKQSKARSGKPKHEPVQARVDDDPIELDDDVLAKRKGRERKGRPVGRYMMCVHVQEKAIQIAVLEGRHLIEHYVSHPSDNVSQIHGNVYLGRVQNVLPGMEAAFVDIGTPKNAVLYRGDVHYDPEDVEEGGNVRIEQMLRPRQSIICQVTKNPIAHKGARLTQEVSLPGRFVVLIPNSKTYGISKRLPDTERKRLRTILDRVKPPEHGLIVRTAAEGITATEIERDVTRLVEQWHAIERLAQKSSAPSLLYTEPDMALRVIREEFNKDYRGVMIDDPALHAEMLDYVKSITPALADRVQLYDRSKEKLSLFERFHVHEQLQKALDRKVWLPSGGSLIIDHTEALTVIDVNTGKNVGSKSLEETVYRNNLEAAEEIARQLRLRDIGGIIVIDFVDMEIRENREETIRVFREALARDKTRTQVFDISELGLVEMTRKRIGEGLLEGVSHTCPACGGRGLEFDEELIGEDT
ncbi:MAG: Rne/Rng family ribonuclease [Actinomycetota bacterium]|nr:Rne/Rng family ribonuclease [Actinomycetota bacterium]